MKDLVIRLAGNDDRDAAILTSAEAWYFTMADKDMDTTFSVPAEH